MYNMKIFAAAIVVAMSVGMAAAQDCSNPNIDQNTMNQCAYQGWQAADAELNAVWKRAMAVAKRMDDYTPNGELPTSKVLLNAQRAWIPFRDQACEAESNLMRGGSAQPLLKYGCMERLTRARTADLRYYADLN